MWLDVFTVAVSEKTTWIFLRLTDANGVSGAGEATLNTRTQDVLGAVPKAVELADRADLSLANKLRAVREGIPGVIGRVLAAGIEQAWLDCEGRRVGRPVHELLGGTYRGSVPCYANINRGTLSRSPDEFAERAAAAISEGYGAIKLAPFDGVTPDANDDAARCAAIEAGFNRIGWVVARLGQSGSVMVDCHSRFRPSEVDAMLERIASSGVAWFEEPLAETPGALEAIAHLRSLAERRGVTLAGAEKCADTADFLPFIVRRCYDVIMPDIVLAGGPREVVRIGHLAAFLGCGVSLHNPCGPVMDMHSLHVAAAVPNLRSMERQYRETPLYDEIISHRAHLLADGVIRLGDAVGLGLEVDWTHPALGQLDRFSIEL